MATPDVETAVEQAIAAAESGKTHDPRIDEMYKRDRVVIYAFVVALWAVLWTTFFLAANPYIDDNGLRWFLIGLAACASIFNTTGMIQNIRRLKHEAVRFYSQDLFWQDQRAALKAELRQLKEAEKRQRTA